MPDDEKATEQGTMEEEPNEMEEAFAEDIGDEETPKEDKEKGKAKSEAEGKKEPEKKTEKKDKEEKPDEGKEEEEEEEEDKKAEKKKGEEKEEKGLTVEEKLQKRIEALDAEEEEEEETPPDKGKKEEEEPEKKEKEEPEPTKLNKETLAERLKLISKDDLPEEIIIGDETINLKQYAEDYPDDFAAIRVLSSIVAEKMVDKALGGLEMPDTGKVTERMDNLEVGMAQLSFDSAVVQATDDEGNLKHPDFFNITRGEGMKDFHAWVKEQSPKIQKLANSLNPEDGILILDYYKEHLAEKKTAEHDKKTKDKKKEYDDIYKSEKSVKKNQRESGNDDKSPDEIAEEAFNEES